MSRKFSFSVLILIILGITTQVEAALPPLYQSKKEIEAILADPQFGEYLPSGDQIQEITKTPSGYLIVTNNRILSVTLHYQEERQPGPVPFTLEFKTAVTIKE